MTRPFLTVSSREDGPDGVRTRDTAVTGQRDSQFHYKTIFGAAGQCRSDYLLGFNQALYQLSYDGISHFFL